MLRGRHRGLPVAIDRAVMREFGIDSLRLCLSLRLAIDPRIEMADDQYRKTSQQKRSKHSKRPVPVEHPDVVPLSSRRPKEQADYTPSLLTLTRNHHAVALPSTLRPPVTHLSVWDQAGVEVDKRPSRGKEGSVTISCLTVNHPSNSIPPLHSFRPV